MRRNEGLGLGHRRLGETIQYQLCRLSDMAVAGIGGNLGPRAIRSAGQVEGNRDVFHIL